ncbi:hypothetical protein PVK06_038923 [Gossypium arboreum]|uniref:RNase H type-1 domain-containing protein n=1 Tax=Gossypium arboreum TaxID=29729 RepID=A0ABR0N1H9_GOSAR|nr:hypothetical protein PVK06_038923 [Gossypium arboreum]
MTELMAIKAAVEMSIGLNRKAHVPLIIELSSVVVAEWLINRRHRPWSLRNLFENINYGARQMAGFQVVVTHRQSNGMVDVLAK